jgi:two-component system response regulator QseB
MRILVVEDNRRLADLVCDGLSRRGFACDVAGSLAVADTALDAACYDAMVLDLGLPEGDTLCWLRARHAGRHLPPTIIQTARGSLDDRVLGLDAGADDYGVKPVDPEELAARIRALLRRPGQRMPAVLEAGPIRFDVAQRAATLGGRPLALSRREADLLELLLRHAGAVVRRGATDDALYSYDAAVTPNAVEAVISRLRRKLEEAGGDGLLMTVRGVGYLLRAGRA